MMGIAELRFNAQLADAALDASLRVRTRHLFHAPRNDGWAQLPAFGIAMG